MAGRATFLISLGLFSHLISEVAGCAGDDAERWLRDDALRMFRVPHDAGFARRGGGFLTLTDS